MATYQGTSEDIKFKIEAPDHPTSYDYATTSDCPYLPRKIKSENAENHILRVFLVRIEDSTDLEVMKYLTTNMLSRLSVARIMPVNPVIKEESQFGTLAEDNLLEFGNPLEYGDLWNFVIPQSGLPEDSRNKKSAIPLCESESKSNSSPGVKPYDCSICKRCFSLKKGLKDHMMTHSGVKPHKCSVCEKCFSRKFDLKKHMVLHSGVRPYVCSVCKTYFSQRSHLNNHMNLHSRVKPFKCNVCNKCYSQNDGLKKHMMLHSGIKPNKCSICKKCFSQKSHLNSHLKLHTGIKEYKCNICKRCFSQKGHLKRHMASIHNAIFA